MFGNEVRTNCQYFKENLHNNYLFRDRSLAYVELYMTIAVLVRRFDMVLHETTEKDVEIARDRLFGYPRGPSQGVRIITTAIKD